MQRVLHRVGWLICFTSTALFQFFCAGLVAESWGKLAGSVAFVLPLVTPLVWFFHEWRYYHALWNPFSLMLVLWTTCLCCGQFLALVGSSGRARPSSALSSR